MFFVRIAFLCLLAIIGFSSQTHAEPEQICEAFLKNPKLFTPVATYGCSADFVGKCFEHELDGMKQKFIIETAGTCATDMASIYNGEATRRLYYSGLQSDGEMMGTKLEPLSYQGQLYIADNGKYHL